MKRKRLVQLELASVHIPLDEDFFWSVIDKTLHQTSSQKQQLTLLSVLLSGFRLEEIIGFTLRTNMLLYQSYNSDMWCAAELMNGICSDDSFEYFRNWVISRGKDVYYAARVNPDSLIEQAVAGQKSYEFEEFWYLGADAFELETGEDISKYIDYKRFSFVESNYPGLVFNWSRSEPESMKTICPRLFEEFWIWPMAQSLMVCHMVLIPSLRFLFTNPIPRCDTSY